MRYRSHPNQTLTRGKGGKPKFLDTAEGLGKGHVFDAIGQNIQPPELVSTKYSIDPG